MLGGIHGGDGGYREADWYRKEQELSKLSAQELFRLKTTTAQRVFRVLYTAFGVALLLLLIVAIVGANVFHWR
jgi:hypothetical protein